MDDPPPARVQPTAAWLAEQEAKQRAYETKRRAWTEKLTRGAAPEAEDAPEAAPAAPASLAAPTPASPARRQRGVVHDPWQGRLKF